MGSHEVVAEESSRRHTVLVLMQPIGAGIGAIFAFGVLIVATRGGQFANIASFGAGAAIAALASVVVGGGTTLAYTTGSIPRQSAVRAVRSLIVLPVVVVASVAAMFLYGVLAHLDAAAVLAGGIATAASVGAELDASYLRRHLKSGRLLTCDISSRIVAFLVVLGGGQFAYGMLVGALTRSLLLRCFSAPDPSRRGSLRIRPRSLALAYEVKLTGLSILYSVCDRIGALVAPSAAPVSVAGGFVAVVSAQQNVSGVLLTGLQGTLAARSQQGTPLRWANRADWLFVASGLLAAAVMITVRDPLQDFLGLGSLSAPGLYWIPLALLIPGSLASRALEFRLIASQASHGALISRSAAGIIAGLSACTALVQSQLGILAWGLLAAELSSVVLSLAYSRRARHSVRRN